ncbi:MAG: creatininase family protein [Bauldia sp.]|nr:MAG: creatininase family protein [Bauldia sp.]
MTKEVRWERMFPDQLEAAFAARPLLYLTYGLCEPHGPHNALGLDALKAHALACAAAQAHGGIVAPPDYWHIHELGQYAVWLNERVGNVERGWMTALPPWQHFKNVCYQIRTADNLGFHAAILLTGHYGANWEDLKTLVGLVQPHVGVRLHALPDFEANPSGFFGTGGDDRDHAGKVETSQLMALEPALVDLSRLPKPDQAGPHFALGEDIALSSRRVGDRMVAEQIAWLGKKGAELLDLYEASRPAARLRTYEQVETLWDAVVAPTLGSFLTMRDSLKGGTVPDDSVWHANWRVPARSGKG